MLKAIEMAVRGKPYGLDSFERLMRKFPRVGHRYYLAFIEESRNHPELGEIVHSLETGSLPDQMVALSLLEGPFTVYKESRAEAALKAIGEEV